MTSGRWVHLSSTEMDNTALVQAERQDAAPLCSFLSNVIFLTCVHASSEAPGVFLHETENSSFLVSVSI